MKCKVLYVDDEIINLEIFKAYFNDTYEITTCLSGGEGLKELENNNEFNVIISDMKMPEMNGIEFIRKAKDLHPEITCFILTGFDITKEIKAALDSKLITEYFSKPLDVDRIASAINKVDGC